jgi:[ribosomal protein S5]-alanine N-acetyltransferase
MSIEDAFTRFPSLTTEHLHLRQIRPTDAEAFFAIKSDREVMDFYGDETHQTIEETQTLIEQIQTSYKKQEALFWGITRKGDDTLIGSCAFIAFNRDFQHAEIGYELVRASWRQGITAEAIAAILTYGFAELELHRIEAVTNPRNTPSKHLLLKLGFTYEGNLRQRFLLRGQFLDAQYFGILKDEWPTVV